MGRSRQTSCAGISAALVALLTSGCGKDTGEGPTPQPTTDPTVELPPPLAPLAPPRSAESDRFATSDHCAQCHTTSSESPAMKDAAGRDVSPVALWRPTMMALAARDPYYLAVFSQELLEHDGATTAVERTCTRCHAPAGNLEHEQTGGHLDFESLVAGESDEAALGRDGVTCSLCHQIADSGLGTTASYTGGFDVGYSRKIFGPHLGPDTEPMQFFVSYEPTYAEHITSSALCATCHTVIVRPLDADGVPTGAEVVEQAPYLEWRNSDFADGGSKAASCSACHLPTADEDGQAITTRIARAGVVLGERSPYGRHILVGGNAYVLRLLSDNEDWAQTGLAAGDLETSAARSEAHVQSAIGLALSASREGDALTIDVTLQNQAGHKFPTGYPTRRAWLHLVVRAGSQIVFESGAHDPATGALVDASGTRLDDPGTILPHRDRIDASDQVQIYESRLVDADGAPTHLALGADHYEKDNRLLPSGWSASHALASVTRAVGVSDDDDFVAGRDVVHYQVAGAPAGALEVEVTLRYQSVPPATIDSLRIVPTPAAVRFVEMATARPPESITVASAQTTVP
ncbi:MAG: hypothetical protein R3B72_23100 [Polyangiaceae bacterium]